MVGSVSYRPSALNLVATPGTTAGKTDAKAHLMDILLKIVLPAVGGTLLLLILLGALLCCERVGLFLVEQVPVFAPQLLYPDIPAHRALTPALTSVRIPTASLYTYAHTKTRSMSKRYAYGTHIRIYAPRRGWTPAEGA